MSPLALQERFTSLFVNSPLSSHQVAPLFGMNHLEISKYVRGLGGPVTPEMVEIMERAVTTIGPDDGPLPFVGLEESRMR